MRRAGARAAVVLLGAALAAVVVLGLWLAQHATDDSPLTPKATAQGASDSNDPPAPPTFGVEPLADGAGFALAAGETGAAAASSEASGDSAAPLRAIIVFADGTPAAGATVVAAAGDLVVDTQITGADGVAAFSITGGRVELYVGGVTPRPQRFEIEPANGEHRLELPAGAFVGGVVLVDGVAPTEPVGLALDGEDEDDEWPGIPNRVRPRLESIDTFFDHRVGQRTTAGRFLFGGLPPDWTGWIGFSAVYRLEEHDAYAQFAVERPATDLVLRLTWDAAVTGRVLRPLAEADGVPQPSPSAEMTVTVTRDGGSFARSGFRTEDDGRFRIPLHAESSATVDLDIRDADDVGRLALHLADLDPVEGRDLGDVVLLASQRVEFLARDEGGQPLAGAVATALDSTRARSRPTAHDGLGSLTGILPDTTGLRVDALGFHPTDVALPQPSGTVVDVVLHRAPLLQIRVVGPDGAPAQRVRFRYRASSLPFESANGAGAAPQQTSLGATTPITWGSTGTETWGRCLTDSEGQVLLSGLLPGVPLEITLDDGFGVPLRPTETIALAPDEQRHVEWRIDAVARSLAVDVADERGQPIAGAEVTLLRTVGADTRSSGTGESEKGADEHGRALFTNLRVDLVTVQVSKSGFATVWRRDVAVPTAGAVVSLTMGAGRTVDVAVVDAQGQPRKVDGLYVTDAPDELAAEQIELGHYRFSELPAGTVTIVARIDKREFTLRHDTSVSRARLVIPALGGLRVTWSFPLGGAGYHVLTRGIAPDIWRSYRLIFDAARATNGPVEFEELLPGDYEVVLRTGRGWTDDNPQVSQVARVTVKPGEVTEVVLSP
jgi:hypothetical protein